MVQFFFLFGCLTISIFILIGLTTKRTSFKMLKQAPLVHLRWTNPEEFSEIPMEKNTSGTLNAENVHFEIKLQLFINKESLIINETYQSCYCI